MQLNSLLTTINAYHPVFFHVPSPTADISSTRILLPGEAVRRRDMLYICMKDYFTALSVADRGKGNFLVLGLHPEEVNFPLEKDLNLILLPDVEDLPRVYNLISDRFLVAQQTSAGLQKMTEALFSNRGLQHLLDVAYSVMQNPIFVSDFSGKYLAAVYDEDNIEPGSAFERFILRDILYRYVDDNGKDVIRKMNLDDILSHTSGPYHAFHDIFKKDAIFANVRVHNVVVGRIFTVALNHPFEHWDETYFEQLVTLVGQELQKNDNISRNRYENESVSLINLLTVSYADAEMLSRCLSTFHLPEKGVFRIGMIHPKSYLDHGALNVLFARLKSILPLFPAAALEDHLIILFYFQENSDVEGYIQERLKDFIHQNNLILGVSNSFNDLSLVRNFYYQALRATFLGIDFAPEKDISFFADISVLELLVTYSKDQNPIELVRPEIQALQKHDEESGTEYIATLTAYLDTMCNSGQAAKNLHIHKNTLLYRINKLTDSFHLDLHNGDTVTQYYLSLQILRLIERMQNFPKSPRQEIARNFF